MAVIKANAIGGHGFDMSNDLDITTLDDYDKLSTTSTLAKFYDNAKNYTSFRGTGFKYKFDDDYLIDLTGGTVSRLDVVTNGVTVASASNLKLSAAVIFDFYVNDDRYGAIEYLTRGNDQITGTKYADQLFGDNGNDTIVGAAGNDTLIGGLGKDVLKGGIGNDVLTGRDGNDILYGGAGADRFNFDDAVVGNRTKNYGTDTIRDFSHVQKDIIVMSFIDANPNTGSTNDFNFIGTDAFSGKGGELRYTHRGGNTYVQADWIGDKAVDFILKLSGLHNLTQSDFYL